jgi:hypothetical protein
MRRSPASVSSSSEASGCASDTSGWRTSTATSSKLVLLLERSRPDRKLAMATITTMA